MPNLGNHPCNRPASSLGCSDGQSLAHPSHEARIMDRDSLTKDQAKTINAKVQPSIGYLFRLRERMVKTGFPPDDPLLALVDTLQATSSPVTAAVMLTIGT